MAHKRNPITAENACGLARVVRSMMLPTWENALLWHERDLANSSAERFTLSHSVVLLDDVMVKCNRVLSKLAVDKENMLRNIENQNGLVMAEKIMLALVDNGIPRDEAHEVLRSASMESLEKGIHLEDVCAMTPTISAIFDGDQLHALFDPNSHLGVSGELVDETVALARAQIN
jgi:adenylosuccinate lyase